MTNDSDNSLAMSVIRLCEFLVEDVSPVAYYWLTVVALFGMFMTDPGDVGWFGVLASSLIVAGVVMIGLYPALMVALSVIARAVWAVRRASHHTTPATPHHQSH